jgi:hypothetical protein
VFAFKEVIAAVLFAAGCGGTTLSQPGGGYRPAYPAAPAPAAASSPELDAFHDELARHGHWERDPSHGSVWVPRERFEPYSRGHWVYGDQGFTWVSEAPHGWATEHYGRWVQRPGGWAWIPGRDWSPAWVAWSESDDAVGWAPLGPGDRPMGEFRYVPTDRFLDRDLDRHYVRVRDHRVRDRLDPGTFQRRDIPLRRQPIESRRARFEEDRQRADEEAERQRNAARGIDDRAAAAARREAQQDRREDQALRRAEQQERRAEQLERRGGPGADPAADARDAARDQRDAERDARDRERALRDAERDARGGVVPSSDREAQVIASLRAQHADERASLERQLAAQFAAEERNVSGAALTRLQARQKQLRLDAIADLEREQRRQMELELARLRARR